MRLSRRSLLTGGVGLAGLVLTGCGPAAGSGRVAATVDSLIGDVPFSIAHRGGGGDWPEMTAFAYAQATKIAGLRALEVSVCLTADNVLVCSHDPTTTRMTGVDYTIAEQTWATLSALQVTAAYTTDPSQPARPFTRLDEVVDAYSERYVLFVEPKVPAATEPLLTKLSSLDQPQRVVWKQYVNSPVFSRAKARGFSTWGYVLNEPSHLAGLSRFAASADIDLLGAPQDESDRFVSDVVEAARRHGKPTVAWPISTVAQRDRVLRLGCEGLMTSRVAELL